jgi:hypothetical protein
MGHGRVAQTSKSDHGGKASERDQGDPDRLDPRVSRDEEHDSDNGKSYRREAKHNRRFGQLSAGWLDLGVSGLVVCHEFTITQSYGKPIQSLSNPPIGGQG